MDSLTIHHLCYYLEEIGIIDQASLPAFLSFYSFALNKNKEKDNSNINNNNNIKKTPVQFEIILCAYLKKIFSVEKNYKIFSNKIIKKFKQKFILKQYNGITLLFSILKKTLNSFKIKSFYKILEFKKEEINITNLNSNNNSKINFSSPSNTNENFHAKKTSIDSFRIKHLYKPKYKDNKDENINNTNKSDILNKSVDYIRIKNDNKALQNTNSTNNLKLNKNNKNIQLEFKKRQFMSKIRREHTVKFKKSNSTNKLKYNYSNKSFESKLLGDFSPKFYNNKSNNFSNNFINIKNKNKNKKNNDKNNENINNIDNIDNKDGNEDNYSNNEYNYNNYEVSLNKEKKNMDYKTYDNINEKYFVQSEISNNNNFNSYYNIYDDEKKIGEKENLNNFIPSILSGQFSTKSMKTNFNSFLYSSPSSDNQNNTVSNYKINNRNNNMGFIIKKKDKNKFMNEQIKSNFNEKKEVLTASDIQRIQQKLQLLNNLDYNS